MSCIIALSNGIRRAIADGGNVRVAVHHETQKELGEIALQRMSPDKVSTIRFELIPENEWDRYPVGVILV